MQNFLVENPPDGPPRVLWRAHDNAPPAKRHIASPYDTDARYHKKGVTVWTGYKLHLTETEPDPVWWTPRSHE